MIGQRALVAALKRFVAHAKLLSRRWPCPTCGREGPDAPLRVVYVIKHGERDESGSFEGCWYCNIEPVIEEAEKALARVGVQVR